MKTYALSLAFPLSLFLMIGCLCMPQSKALALTSTTPLASLSAEERRALEARSGLDLDALEQRLPKSMPKNPLTTNTYESYHRVHISSGAPHHAEAYFGHDASLFLFYLDLICYQYPPEEEGTPMTTLPVSELVSEVWHLSYGQSGTGTVSTPFDIIAGQYILCESVAVAFEGSDINIRLASSTFYPGATLTLDAPADINGNGMVHACLYSGGGHCDYEFSVDESTQELTLPVAGTLDLHGATVDGSQDNGGILGADIQIIPSTGAHALCVLEDFTDQITISADGKHLSWHFMAVFDAHCIYSQPHIYFSTQVKVQTSEGVITSDLQTIPQRFILSE